MPKEEKADAELVAQARAGDKQAFDHLVRRYEALAQRVALGMVTNNEIARDLVQEAMLQAYLSLPHLRDEARFQTWLYGIVLNVCRGHRREEKGGLLSLEEETGASLLGGVSLSRMIGDP